MPVYSQDTMMQEVVMHDLTVLPLLNRFGILLGVSDLTIGEICERKGIDADFFLSVVNTYIKDDYTPHIDRNRWNLKDTVDFLSRTNKYYSDTLLPTIERHFSMLHERSRHLENNISYLWKFFQELKNELLARIRIDETIWFPALLDNGEKLCGAFRLIEKLPSDERAIEDKVNDLVSFFVIHLKGDYDPNLCMGVITSVFALDKEIKKNNRIRQKILRPLTLALIRDEKTE